MLKDKPQFCCWKYEDRSCRKTKVPYNPVTGKRAKPNQRGTFKDFSSAVAAISDYDGIGFLVGNDICVIDLDDCFDSGDKLKPIAQIVVEAFRGCYMEHSPSGKGLHIFFKATGFNFDKTKYYINNRKLGVEVYVAGATNRFVTVTGNVYADGATTRNGKGTLCESILKVLGSYGCTARPETISLKKNNNSSSPSEDIARLAGVRFVNISEPSRGLVLNAAQVKSMTGGDTINARFLHENSFDFSPKFKLYINTNYLPVITDMTLFSSGRVVIIPFERHFDESEQDKNLKREFAKAKNQSAILNWLIEGYQLLKKEGLTLPDSVKTATEAYKRDSDKIALFFEDALEESPNSEVRTSEVYARYQRWCSANGCYSENARNFKQALTAIARVERKRPRSGGGMTTMLIGYKLTEEEFLLI